MAQGEERFVEAVRCFHKSFSPDNCDENNAPVQNMSPREMSLQVTHLQGANLHGSHQFVVKCRLPKMTNTHKYEHNIHVYKYNIIYNII